MTLDPDDGGYRSRKLWYAVGTSASIVGVAVLAAWKLPSLGPLLDTVVGGLVATLAIYSGVNVANKFTVAKSSQPLTSEEPEKEPAKKNNGEDEEDYK